MPASLAARLEFDLGLLNDLYDLTLGLFSSIGMRSTKLRYPALPSRYNLERIPGSSLACSYQVNKLNVYISGCKNVRFMFTFNHKTFSENEISRL